MELEEEVAGLRDCGTPRPDWRRCGQVTGGTTLELLTKDKRLFANIS